MAENTALKLNYSVEVVARLTRCAVDPATFLYARPEVNLSLNALNRRCRAGKLPGAFRLPGARQWNIDLVTYDRVVGSMLASNEESILQSIEAAREELPVDLQHLVGDDSSAIMAKVMQRLQRH